MKSHGLKLLLLMASVVATLSSLHPAVAGTPAANLLMPDLGLGIVRLGETESEFKKVFKADDGSPVGDSGECTIYDIDRAEIQRLMPWIDTDVIELVFSPKSRGGAQESILTEISIGIAQSSALAAEYKKFLGPSTFLNGDEHVESWKLSDGSMLYINQSSITFAIGALKC